MKRTVLILVLLASRLYAQIAPPQLRCLEVLPNGNVILFWVPPADPSGQFASYEVYCSPAFKTGPYSMVLSGLGPITQTTALHPGNTASTQSSYYYMVVRDANNLQSGHSDTLQTIKLTVTNGNPALQLTYNNVHAPSLPSTSSTYTITKEYPLGTVNNLTITPNLQHPDVISICTANINYQVLLQDNNAICISKSNTIYGLYTDTKIPDEPVVDSISVLPDGRTILAWKIAPDMDVDRYPILERIPPSTGNTALDTVRGRTNTSYIRQNTDAQTRAVQLFVSALDSCKTSQGSTFNTDVTTMFVRTEYSHCSYSTRLTWNDYRGMLKGIKEYRIYCSIDGGEYVRVGSTQTTTYTHDSVPPNHTVCYFVRVVNGDASITASSNRTCFFSREVEAPGYIYQRFATVNENQDVEIQAFTKDQTSISGVRFLRAEDAGGPFKELTFIPYNGTQFYAYADETAETSERPYFYKCILVDSCGNNRSTSNVCKTILLQIDDPAEDTFTRSLTWTAYEGFAMGINEYRIYRVVGGAASFVAAVPSTETSYVDNFQEDASKGSSVSYLVVAVENLGNPYFASELSTSNRRDIYPVGQIYIPNTLAVNGINNTWKPVTHFIDKNEYRVRIFDRWGKQMFETRSQDEAWDGGGNPQGVYVYLITYKDALGEYKQEKGHVLLLK